MTKPKNSGQVTLEVWRGVEGPCLIVNSADGNGGTRVAGPKMWGGGGTLIASFKIDRQELANALAEA